MQIFVPHKYNCDMFLDDRRLNKAILENAQIISTVLREARQIETPIKSTHIHHPTIKWTAKSDRNLDFLIRQFVDFLCAFYNRFGHRHSYEVYLDVYNQCRYSLDIYNSSQYLEDLISHEYISSIKFDELNSVYQKYQALLLHKWIFSKSNPIWTTLCNPFIGTYIEHFVAQLKSNPTYNRLTQYIEVEYINNNKLRLNRNFPPGFILSLGDLNYIHDCIVEYVLKFNNGEPAHGIIL